MHKVVRRYILFLILIPDCFAAGAIQTILIYRPGSPISVHLKYDALKKDPISITVKLEKFYAFTSPGNYTLEWGSKNSLTHKYNFIVR
jgi:hypothetical protein